MAGLVVVAPSAAWGQAVTLDEVLQQVPERHETHQITEMQIRQSRAFQRQALAALLPRLDASANLTRQGVDERQVGDDVVVRRFDWGANASLSMRVFDGPAYFDYWEAGKLLEVTEQSAQWQRNLLMLEAEQAFYTLASAQREVEIAEAAIEWRVESLERAEALLEVGEAIPVDVSRARAEVLEAEQALLEAEAVVGNAADSLATLLGRAPDGELRADVEPDDVDLQVPAVAGELTEERSDLAAQRAGIEASELGRRGVWWTLAPRVDLSLNSGWGRPSLFNPDRHTWAVVLSATWNLYDGGGRYARADAAQAEVRQQELELERDLRDANVQLHQALRQWRTSVAAIAVAEEQVELAQETFEQTLARFEQGLVSSLEVSDASQELLNAELRLNQVQLQARLAEVQYRYLGIDEE